MKRSLLYTVVVQFETSRPVFWHSHVVYGEGTDSRIYTGRFNVLGSRALAVGVRAAKANSAKDVKTPCCRARFDDHVVYGVAMRSRLPN